MDEKPAVILDCGSSWCRAGFSHQNESESVVIRSVIGYPKDENQKQVMFGDEALSHRQDLRLKLPYQFGYIACWEEAELMWQTLINDKLKAQTEEHPFLIVQTGFVPRLNLEKTAETFFEHYRVPSLCYRASGELSLLSTGCDTGTVVEVGGGACFPVPVFKGHELRHLMQRTEFSGRDLTAAFSRMLSQTNDSITAGEADFETINTLKEKYCYCAENYEEECKSFTKEKEINYPLPDGTKSLTIGPEQFQCPESLFKPILAQKEFSGLHEIVFKCIRLCEDESAQCELFSNIVLCGGSSLFPGLAPRLQQELESLALSVGCSNKINVSVSPFRHAAFEGAKMFARDKKFIDMCWSKESYDEYGPYAISNCFRSVVL